MLTTDEHGRPQFAVNHLVAGVPTTLKEVIARYSNLSGTLFHHVVSSPECRYETKFGAGRVPEDIAGMPARDRLINILTTRRILGNPKSYFVNKPRESLAPAQMDEIKSVSFAL